MGKLDDLVFGSSAATAKQPFEGAYAAMVVSATTESAEVTIDGFSASSSYSAEFEPRFGSGGSPQTPPPGTRCTVLFTGRIAAVPNTPYTGVGVTIRILAFKNWPT